jgi:hypothetical protein
MRIKFIASDMIIPYIAKYFTSYFCEHWVTLAISPEICPTYLNASGEAGDVELRDGYTFAIGSSFSATSPDSAIALKMEMKRPPA